MKKLFYKGEFLREISEGDAEKISKLRGIQVMIDGEMLKKSQIEIRNLKNDENRLITDYSTEELREIIGNFEKEYDESATGEVVRNEILGYVKEGTIAHALKFGAITVKNIRGEKIYSVKLPEFYSYNLKHNALRELIYRREYAEKINLIN